MIVYLSEPVDISSRISARSTWVDIDISDITPSGTDGVILGIGYEGSNDGQSYHYTVRKKGSVDDRKTHNRTQAYADGAILAFTGVDSNRVFQYYTNNPLAGTSEPTLFLRGYTTEDEFSYRTDSQDITPAGTGWQTIDVSSYLDSNYANGAVLVQIENWQSAYKDFDIRAVGDTVDLYASGKQLWNLQHKFYIVSLNAGRQFQFARQDANVKLYLWGGVKSTFYTNINRDSGGFQLDCPDGEQLTWVNETLDYSGVLLALAYNCISPSYVALKKPSDPSWTPPPYYQHNRDTGTPEPLIIPTDENKQCQRYFKDIEVASTDFYYTGKILTPSSYSYEGEVPLNLNVESTSSWQHILEVIGTLQIVLNPESAAVHNYHYTQEGNLVINFYPISDYELYTPPSYVYEGNLLLRLRPESDSILATSFTHIGDLTFTLTPDAITGRVYEYEGEVFITLNVNSFYSLAAGFYHQGNLVINLNPESVAGFGIEVIGNLLIELFPEAIVTSDLVVTVPLQKRPTKILAAFRNLLKLRGETVLVYPAILRDKCDLEKKEYRKFLNPLPIKALVKDFSPDGQRWNPYGVTDIGAKELVLEKKWKQLMKVGAKLRIRNENYVVFREKSGSRHQIWQRADFVCVIVTKL